MPELIQIGSPSLPGAASAGNPPCCPVKSTSIYWLQGVTLAWMLIELGVSAYAAVTAHSAAMLAFGADSLVELFSAMVVLLQYLPGWPLSVSRAHRIAAGLLFALAAVVTCTATAALLLHAHAETSCSGIGITLAALVAMPVLAALKRREARRRKDAAMAADAVQSATCAYLALTALCGLAANAIFHIAWLDAAAALVAVPILIKEGRSAWHGQACGCC